MLREYHRTIGDREISVYERTFNSVILAGPPDCPGADNQW